MSGIWYDMDNTDAFYNAPVGKMGTEFMDMIVDRVTQGKQVKKYFMCPGSSCAIFDGEYWEIYANGFDLDKGIEQKPMCGSKNAWYYQFAHNLHSILKMGVDPVKHIMDRIRANGVEAWLSMRMNDIHCGEDEASPIHCSFWKQHPELRISSVPSENGFDYSHKQVRDYILNRATELIERYEMDGLQLDWTRWPTFFPHQEGPDKAGLITQLVSDIKDVTKKHKIPLGMRVPGHIDICLNRGLDVVQWNKNKLINHVVIAPFNTIDFDLPIEEWKDMLNNSDIPIAYGLVSARSSYPGADRRFMSAEDVRGVTDVAYHKGADAIYLFNYFQKSQNEYPEMFNEIGECNTLKNKDRSYGVTWHDNLMTIGELHKMTLIPGWGEKWLNEKIKNGNYPFTFPSRIPTGQQQKFVVFMGLHSGKNAQCKVCFDIPDEQDVDIEISVNNSDKLASIKNNQREQILDTKHLLDGHNQFMVFNKGQNLIEILDLQVKVSF